MKTSKLVALTAAVAGSLVSSASMAGASANVGFVSDYYFRGIFQSASSASAGLDYAHDSGVYVGTWWADVDEGLETDFYAGYAGEAQGLSYDISYILYDYTDDFDEKYTEINLKLGYGPLSLEYADGEYDSSPTADYTYTAITAEHKGFYVKFASFGADFDGSYTEVGYGTEVGGFDLGLAIMNNDKDLDIKTSAGDGETTMTFSLGKSFDL